MSSIVEESNEVDRDSKLMTVHDLSDYSGFSVEQIEQWMEFGLNGYTLDFVVDRKQRKRTTLTDLRCFIGDAGFTLPCEPTVAHPGSPEKVEVLRSRVEANQFLFHPDDEKDIRCDAGSVGRLSGKCIHEEVIERARIRRKRGESIDEIAIRLDISLTAVRRHTADVVPEEKLVEPWLLKREREFLEAISRGVSERSAMSNGCFNRERLMRKLGVEKSATKVEVLAAYEEYKQRQTHIERQAEAERIWLAEEERRRFELEESIRRSLVLNKNKIIDWSNVDLKRIYQLSRAATFWLRKNPDREDVQQELVLMSPRIIADFGNQIGDMENYIYKAFCLKSVSLLRSAPFRSTFLAAKRQNETQVKSVDYDGPNGNRLSEMLGIPNLIEGVDKIPCVVCSKMTTRQYVCSDDCGASLAHYKGNLNKLAQGIKRVIDQCRSGKPQTIEQLKAVAKSIPQTLAWIWVLGYSIELSPEGYIIEGPSKLEKACMDFRSCKDPKVINLLRNAGVRQDGMVDINTLSVAQQIMLYRIQPWETHCIMCRRDTTNHQSDSLMARYYVSITCGGNCRSQINKLRSRKGWLI